MEVIPELEDYERYSKVILEEEVVMFEDTSESTFEKRMYYIYLTQRKSF